MEKKTLFSNENYNFEILQEQSHRRFNPLTEKWILISPTRVNRPWFGQKEVLSDLSDGKNYLAPGCIRSSGKKNPQYTSTFVFDNDFSALNENTDITEEDLGHPLFKISNAKGLCKVMCFHPDCKAILPLMQKREIVAIINTWIEQMLLLKDTHTWIQIFENKGRIMGCSNPHPHCQIWACQFLPSEPQIKDSSQKKYYMSYKLPLLLDYLNMEIKKQERIVFETYHWICMVPFWAVWPFETMLLPKRHVLRLYDLSEEEISDLANALQLLTTLYDNLFSTPFPYSMGWHGAPTGTMLSCENIHWQLHASFLPPLLRSANVAKFMVGFELFAEQQRDLTPEKAALILRSQSREHYTLRNLLL